MLNLYCLFHLNLAYSAIEEESRPSVVKKCYWPLLELATDLEVPLAIELSGYTLQQIADIDAAWIEQLAHLIADGKVELVGSGYAQIIGPLVPAEVNSWNQRLGLQLYQKMFGVRPEIALINEMAYSAGILEHYLESGYRAIIMEWNNPRRFHPEWSEAWRYWPQYAAAADGRSIPVIWLDCIAFQKLQRYAHGEDSISEYLRYLDSHQSRAKRYFPLYGSDAEVFDFRPGRYATEAMFAVDGEWQRLRKLFARLLHKNDISWTLPSGVLAGLEDAGHRLRIESPEQPVSVKKQEKYNLTRWAATGRDDLTINTLCYRIYEVLKARQEKEPVLWRELCYLWSSDFRTHIVEPRWQIYRSRLQRFYEKHQRHRKPITATVCDGWHLSPIATHKPLHRGHFEVIQGRKFLTVVSPRLKVVFNLYRGLAIESCGATAARKGPLFGTLPHGFYRDIAFGADFYSGHTVIEIPGKKRITDLSRVQPMVSENAGRLLLQAVIDLGVGEVTKSWTIFANSPHLKLSLRFKLKNLCYGTIRTGYLTLLPDAFDLASLSYRVRNGGHQAETFPLHGHIIRHDLPVSTLISARSGLGCSDGLLELADKKNTLRIEVDRTVSAAMPMLRHERVDDSIFCRVIFSLLELDETRVDSGADYLEAEFEQTISIITTDTKNESG